MKRKPVKFGATGKFPDGKLSDTDEGEIAFGVAADVENGLVHIEFGEPVKALAMPPEHAMRLVRLLVAKASEVQGTSDGSAQGAVGGADGISYQSIVSHRTQQGMVLLTWGENAGQLDLDTVRVLALALLDAASAAENDSLLIRFMSQKVEMPLEDAAKFLDGMRHFRAENIEKEEAQENS